MGLIKTKFSGRCNDLQQAYFFWLLYQMKDENRRIWVTLITIYSTVKGLLLIYTLKDLRYWVGVC